MKLVGFNMYSSLQGSYRGSSQHFTWANAMESVRTYMIVRIL
jgi:hypothetical protein